MFTTQLQTPMGLTEMITAMAAQQPPVYTAVPAYGGLEAYAQYPQYVTQVGHGAYITSAPAAPPQQVLSRPRDPFVDGFGPQAVVAPTTVATPIYEDPSRVREICESRERKERDRESHDRRDRHRERDRSRDRSRDRDHRDRSDRDRDRDRRDRDRDDDRRDRDDDRERSPRGRDRDFDRDGRDSAFDDDFRAPDLKSMPPNNTIMVRGLAQHITENDIRADILSCNLMPKDIRLVRKKESGASRGFAFVEFTTVHDATRWMEAKQGVLFLQDSYRATLQYSIPKEACDRQNKQSQDWFCIRCGAHNFKRRDSCFKCASPRHESESGDEGSDEVCNYPTNMLLIRGLDVLTTEEGVLSAIEGPSAGLPIRSVRVGRDPLTNTSRGLCYIELNSVLHSMQLFNKLAADPPVVDGKQASISYCKLNQGGSSGQSHSQSQQQQHQPMEYTAGADIKKLAEYSASVYAQTPEEHAAYVQYYTTYYQQQAQASKNSTTQSDSVNAAAAVAQSALQAMQQKASGGAASSAASSGTTIAASEEATAAAATAAYEAATEGEYPKYPAPDVSAYKFDESSGYYYDPSTGLYYDAATTYYYNAEAGHYLYWDAEKSTYLPAPSGGEEAGADGDTKGATDQSPKKDMKDGVGKQDKVKVAKKIAKDMERWAKAQNKRNDTRGGVMPMGGDAPLTFGLDGCPPATGPVGGAGGAADAAFAVLLERRDRGAAPFDKHGFQMQLKKEAQQKSGLVAAYGGEGSDSDEERDTSVGNAVDAGTDRVDDDGQLVDVSKMACLLCKRQFPNKDALTKHVQLSNLHRTNLEALARADSAATPSQQYRDRAKERRQKYGQALPPAPPSANKLKERYIAVKEEVNQTAATSGSVGGGGDSVANKMMKKMGWTDGQGLGKSNQGRTSIVEAERRVASAGLGVHGAAYGVAGDTYKDCVKKMMFHRYKELDAMEKANY